MRRQAVVNAIRALAEARAAVSRLMVRRMMLLACVLLAADASVAAGREPASRQSVGGKSKASATSTTDDWHQGLAAWLARLEGRFNITLRIAEKTVCNALGGGQPGATQACTTQKAVTYVSAAHCLGTGDGSGLQCNFDELRYEATDNAGGVGAPAFLLSNRLPSRVVFGIDPAARKISVVITDSNGASYNANGKLAGNELALKERCAVDTSRVSGSCTWGLWIKAPPDGRRILMTRTSSRGSSTEFRTLSGLGEPHTFELSKVE
jgi:hypothetical protein